MYEFLGMQGFGTWRVGRKSSFGWFCYYCFRRFLSASGGWDTSERTGRTDENLNGFYGVEKAIVEASY